MAQMAQASIHKGFGAPPSKTKVTHGGAAGGRLFPSYSTRSRMKLPLPLPEVIGT